MNRPARVRIAPEVLERLGEARRGPLLSAAGVVQAEEVTLATRGPFAWAELVPRFRNTVVRLAPWGADNLLAFTDPRAPDAVIAEAQPALPADMEHVLAVMAMCELPALSTEEDIEGFYDVKRMLVPATPRLREELEPPHMEGAVLVYLSHRRRQGSIVRVRIDGESFTVACDVLGTAGELHLALRAPR